MPQDAPLDATDAASAPARVKPSNYPPRFASNVAGRQKHPLGGLFGLSNFGVNLTRPGASSPCALHLQAVARPDGSWIFTREDGTPY